MRHFIKKNQIVIVLLLLLFFIGRVLDLHSHAHFDIAPDFSEKHSSSTFIAPFIEHSHQHISDSAHIINHVVNGTHNAHDSHGDGVFDIQLPSVFSKLKIDTDTNTIFIIAIFFIFLIHRSYISRFRSHINNPPYQQRLFLKNRNLRAPPFHV